jgi:hypothetical protein
MNKCKFCSLDIDDDILCDFCSELIDNYLKTKKHFKKVKEKFESLKLEIHLTKYIKH